MKYLTRFSAYFAAVLIGLFCAATVIGVDPSLAEQRITNILAKQLDEFPPARLPGLARHLLDECHRYHFDPAFVLAVIEVESGFRVEVQSQSGAVGLMQVMPATALKTASELKDPFLNLSVGIAYLAHLRDRYAGMSPYFLLAAYNIGPAKLDLLRAKKSFTPVKTKKYYENIRTDMGHFGV